MIGTAASRLLRSTALVTCSLGALLAAPAVSQASGTITPLYGNLHPFYGNLHPFYGNLHPFSADVSTTYGDVTPFYGNLHPFYGNLHPFTAATDPASVAFYGASSSNDYWGQGVNNPFTWVPKAGASNQIGSLNYIQYSQIGGFWTNQTNTWLPLWQTWQTAQDNIAAASSATSAATNALTSATSSSAAASAAVSAAAAQTAAADKATSAAKDATNNAKTAAQKTAAANATAAAASATAAAASATTSANNAQTAAASAMTSANNQVAAANAQSTTAYSAIKSVSTNLQSLFFGTGGAANSPSASLATFWAAEIASRPKGQWGAINGVSQNYNRIVSKEIYKVLKPYGAVLTLDATGSPVIDLTSTANVKALAQATAGDQAQIYSNI